jgi:hypothetical protein
MVRRSGARLASRVFRILTRYLPRAINQIAIHFTALLTSTAYHAGRGDHALFQLRAGPTDRGIHGTTVRRVRELDGKSVY